MFFCTSDSFSKLIDIDDAFRISPDMNGIHKGSEIDFSIYFKIDDPSQKVRPQFFTYLFIFLYI